MVNWRTALIFGILILTLGFFQYHLWLEEGGLKDTLALKEQYRLQLQENQKLKKLNDELSFQIERLQNNKESMEGRARSELGMIKKDEKFYQVVKGR